MIGANILFSLGLILLFAKIFGEIAERLGVASLVGELTAGVIAGPILGLVSMDPFIENLLTVCIIFLLFMAGLEIKFEDIKKHTYSASILAFLGGIFSFIFGFFVGMMFFNDPIISFAIGTVMISTSNGTLFLFLMKTGEFDSKIGKLIIATTIADDVVGILFISFFSVYIKSHELALNTVFFIFLVSIGFYLVMFTAGSKILNAILDFAGKFLDTYAIFTIPLAVAFIMAYVTDNIGLSIAAGAFLTGMAIANSQYSETVIRPRVNVIAQGFLLPVFYAAVGVSLVLTGLNWFLIAMIVIASVLGKIVGIGFFSRFFGVKKDHSKLFGIIMIPRGNENVAIVEIILALGVITFEIYTSIIFAMVATVLLTPVLLKIFYK